MELIDYEAVAAQLIRENEDLRARIKLLKIGREVDTRAMLHIALLIVLFCVIVFIIIYEENHEK